MTSQLINPASIKWPIETLKVLDICQHIHKHAEEFYQYLVETHQEHTEIARMWGLFAIDKCNHSDAFKMVSRLRGEGLKEINMSAEVAANILLKVKSIPRGEKHNPPSVLDALRFTIRMEENLASVHFSHVVKFHSEQNASLMASSLQSSNNIIHVMTEEYVNLTVLNADVF